MVIDTNGNAGIGTATPPTRLHVVWNSVGTTSQRFTDAALFENSGNVFLQMMGGLSNEKSINFATYLNGADGAIKYSFPGAPGFSFWTGGNSFTGSASGGVLQGDMSIRAGGNSSTGTLAALQIDNDRGRFARPAIVRNSIGVNLLIIDDFGRTGLGFGAPSSPSNILTIPQNSSTDPIADSWTVYSSQRWKTNVTTLVDSLAVIKQLRGVSFKWKETGRHDIGLIAEEVGHVLPDLVTYEENGIDAQGLDYSRIVPILIEAIKSQQAQIELLQKQVQNADKESRASVGYVDETRSGERITTLNGQLAALQDELSREAQLRVQAQQQSALLEARISALESQQSAETQMPMLNLVSLLLAGGALIVVFSRYSR
jgi:hypothetical protein